MNAWTYWWFGTRILTLKPLHDKFAFTAVAELRFDYITDSLQSESDSSVLNLSIHSRSRSAPHLRTSSMTSGGVVASCRRFSRIAQSSRSRSYRLMIYLHRHDHGDARNIAPAEKSFALISRSTESDEPATCALPGNS